MLIRESQFKVHMLPNHEENHANSNIHSIRMGPSKRGIRQRRKPSV